MYIYSLFLPDVLQVMIRKKRKEKKNGYPRPATVSPQQFPFPDSAVFFFFSFRGAVS